LKGRLQFWLSLTKIEEMKKLLLALFLITGVFNLHSQVANQADDLELCDTDNDGFEIFDLTLNDAVIFGGQDPADFILSYYLTQADANLGINTILNPQNYINTANPESIFARLERLANGNFDTTDFALILYATPFDFGPFELVQCADYLPNEGASIFDLTTLENQITAGDPNLFVNYYATLADLNANIPIVDPTAYENVVNPQTIYIRITDGISGCVTDITLDLRVILRPDINHNPTPLESCGEDGFGVFDLTLKDEEIVNGVANVRINYFLTHLDAQNDTLPVLELYNNDDAYFDTVWVRVTFEVPHYELPCFEVIDLTLIVLDSCPDIDAPPVDIFINEGDGDGLA